MWLMTGTWPKSCGCGQEFSRETFRALPLVGMQEAGEEDGREFELELRNCPTCNSTLAIEWSRAMQEVAA